MGHHAWPAVQLSPGPPSDTVVQDSGNNALEEGMVTGAAELSPDVQGEGCRFRASLGYKVRATVGYKGHKTEWV